MTAYKNLFKSIKINGVTLSNRIAFAPMGNGLGTASGEVSEREMAYFEARAKGGCGLIYTGYAAVSPPERAGLAHINQIHVYTHSHRTALQALAERIHKYASAIFVQLHHPGALAPPYLNMGQAPWSPSGIAPNAGSPSPVEMTKEQIAAVVEDFAVAAENCFIAGIDGVMLHCAHGYLLDEFMNPRLNKRTDEYGGSLENRLRIVREIMEAIRRRVPRSYPVIARVSATDGSADGLNTELSVKHALYLETLGVDAIDVSLATPDNLDSAYHKSGWKSEYIKPFKDALHIPVIAANSVKEPEYASGLITDGIQDVVSIGRAQIADPQWARKAKEGRGEAIVPCLRCLVCHAVFYQQQGLRCAVNPLAGREIDRLEAKRAGEGETIAVIGAGPAGITAALTASDRGYRVILIDGAREVGGSLNLANKAPDKDRIQALLDYYKRELARRKIELRLGCKIDERSLEALGELKPKAVLLATGGSPIVPNIPIGAGASVYTANEVLSAEVLFKEKRIAVIGGGMTGIETAELLASQGNSVAIYEMLSMIGRGMDAPLQRDIDAAMKRLNVSVNTSCALSGIEAGHITLKNMKTGETQTAVADAVVFALGVKSNDKLYDLLNAEFEKVLSLGDSHKPGNIRTAVADGYWKSVEV